MATLPTPTPIDIVDDKTQDSTSMSVKKIMESKFNDAQQWALYASGLIESKLGDINTASGEFDISGFLDEAIAAIEAIPVGTAGSVTYSAPTDPTYGTVPAYSAPTAPTFTAVSYVSPDDAVLEDVTYSAPTLGTLSSIPTPTTYTAGAAPSTEVTFTNPDFTDSLLTDLKARLAADIATASTGLGDAETALFARETARQSAARAAAYTELTSQFSARGFDMPSGALLAKQTEVNNETALRLSDSSSQIMAESARLAVDYNKAVLSNSTQLLDVISKVFDSKVVRDFEAAKTDVTLALEGFKAAIQVITANADLEGKYIGSLGNYNDAIVKAYTGEIDGEASRVNALTDINKSLLGVQTTQIQAETAKVTATASVNKSLADAYTSEVGAAIAEVTSVTDSNKAVSSAYSAAVQGAAADVSAQGETERANAAIAEVNSRIALGVAGITKDTALANIDSATRTFLGEINVLSSASQSAMQFVASALNGVSVSSSLDFGGSFSSTDTTRTEVSDKFGSITSGGETYEHLTAGTPAV